MSQKTNSFPVDGQTHKPTHTHRGHAYMILHFKWNLQSYFILKYVQFMRRWVVVSISHRTTATTSIMLNISKTETRWHYRV